jgi:hypothetical protein
MEKKRVFIFFLLIFLIGCAAETALRMEEGVSLAGYKVFEVVPVSNETGKTFKFDVAAELTKQLKLKLEEKGYDVAGEGSVGEDVLIVNSNLMSYAPGSALMRWVVPGAGATQAVVKTSLIDKKTGTVMGEMATSESVSSGGLFSIGADKWVVGVVATGIADEIDKQVKGK